MRRNLSAYACEFAGTALLLFVGVTAVSFMWAPGSPVPVVENGMLRRLLTGIMFAGASTSRDSRRERGSSPALSWRRS